MDHRALTGREEGAKYRALSRPHSTPFVAEIRMSVNSTITGLTLEIYKHKFQVVSEDYNFPQVHKHLRTDQCVFSLNLATIVFKAWDAVNCFTEQLVSFFNQPAKKVHSF